MLEQGGMVFVVRCNALIWRPSDSKQQFQNTSTTEKVDTEEEEYVGPQIGRYNKWDETKNVGYIVNNFVGRARVPNEEVRSFGDMEKDAKSLEPDEQEKKDKPKDQHERLVICCCCFSFSDKLA